MADTRTLTDRAGAALIRDWAKDNGFEVSEKGRIPAGVRAAYEAATGNAPPDDDGPDWDQAMGEQDAADPLAELEGTLAAEAAAGPGEGAGPPPPADLDEARARFGGKAKRPAWAKGD